jgi:nitroreductase
MQFEDLLEVMRTTGARRRFEARAVAREQLEAVIEAATCAPSGRNRQTWSFIVVQDPELRAAVGAIYREAWYETVAPGLAAPARDEAEARDRRNWRWLADHLGEAPALIFCCVEGPPPQTPAQAAAYYGSIFPAAENLLLAARTLGLGTTLTTVHKEREPELRTLLGAPESLDLVALIPIGYPVNAFGPVRRREAAEVTHFDGWRPPATDGG